MHHHLGITSDVDLARFHLTDLLTVEVDDTLLRSLGAYLADGGARHRRIVVGAALLRKDGAIVHRGLALVQQLRAGVT